MWSDPIVEETRTARAKVIEPFGGDVHAFFEFLRERDGQSSTPAVTLEPVTPEPSLKHVESR
jgi:hypothetical protein